MPEPFVRPDVAAFLAYVNAQTGSAPRDVGIAESRRMMDAARDLVDLPVGPLAVERDLVCPGPAGDIPLRLFDPRPTRGPGPVLMFLHGGSFAMGSVHSHAPPCAEIARTLDLPVVSVGYRLAPEHPFPAGPEDAQAAARWIAASPDLLGRPATGLVLAGDSAGGALAIATALALRDRPADVPVLVQWGIYPAVDAAPGYPSYDDYAEGYFLSAEGMRWSHESYRPDYDDPRAAPIRVSQAGMPPTLILTAGLDPLRDQGRAYAAATALAGVPTVYREAAGTIHGFINLRKVIPSAVADLSGCLAQLALMIAEAEAAR